MGKVSPHNFVVVFVVVVVVFIGVIVVGFVVVFAVAVVYKLSELVFQQFKDLVKYCYNAYRNKENTSLRMRQKINKDKFLLSH